MQDRITGEGTRHNVDFQHHASKTWLVLNDHKEQVLQLYCGLFSCAFFFAALQIQPGQQVITQTADDTMNRRIWHCHPPTTLNVLLQGQLCTEFLGRVKR